MVFITPDSIGSLLMLAYTPKAVLIDIAAMSSALSQGESFRLSPVEARAAGIKKSRALLFSFLISRRDRIAALVLSMTIRVIPKPRGAPRVIESSSRARASPPKASEASRIVSEIGIDSILFV